MDVLRNDIFKNRRLLYGSHRKLILRLLHFVHVSIASTAFLISVLVFMPAQNALADCPADPSGNSTSYPWGLGAANCICPDGISGTTCYYPDTGAMTVCKIGCPSVEWASCTCDGGGGGSGGGGSGGGGGGGGSITPIGIGGGGGCGSNTCQIFPLVLDRYQYLRDVIGRVSGVDTGFVDQPVTWYGNSIASISPTDVDVARWNTNVYGFGVGTRIYNFNYHGWVSCPAPCSASNYITVRSEFTSALRIIPRPVPIVVNVGDTVTFNAKITANTPGNGVQFITAIGPTGPTARATVASTGPNPIVPTTADGENYETQVTGLFTGSTRLRLYVVSISPVREYVVEVPIIVVDAATPICAIPTPEDPPNAMCATTPTSTDGRVIWRWDPVPDADQYFVLIENVNTGDTMNLPLAWRPASDYGPNCENATGPCVLSSNNLPPGQYRSWIRARGLCSESTYGVSEVVDVLVCNDPWWQASSGGVTAATGDIRSPISPACSLPGCVGYLLQANPYTNRPGVAVFGGTDASFGPTGSVSAPPNNWLVNSPTTTNVYNYNYFSSLAQGKTFNELPAGTTVGTATISSATQDGGYSWIRVNGNAVVDQPGVGLQVNNRRVVVFVDGNLSIQSRIRLNNKATDFMMFVVRGNINISPSVVSNNITDAALQGIYACDGTFSTGTNDPAVDQLLVLEGSVASGAVNLQRDLELGNQTSPSEHFIYSPEMIVNYPSTLSRKRLIWREVAP